MPVMTKKKKAYPPVEFMPHDSENKHLSKADFVKKMERYKENKRKIDAYSKKVFADAEDKVTAEKAEADIKSKKIATLERQLEVAIQEAGDAEMNAVSVEDEKKAENLKKDVRILKQKLARAKKA